MTKRTIIGQDNRKRVKDTRTYPFSAVCCLRLLNSNGARGLGSGCVIGDRVVLTAGHNLCGNTRVNAEGWTPFVTVLAGLRNATDNAPHVTVGPSSLRVPKQWWFNRDRRYDFGVIILPHVLTKPVPIQEAESGKVNVIGYPSGRKRTMWAMLGQATVNNSQLNYTIDTSPGQSGSGIFKWQDPPTVIGVHAYGSSRNYGVAFNVHTIRILQELAEGLL